MIRSMRRKIPWIVCFVIAVKKKTVYILLFQFFVFLLKSNWLLWFKRLSVADDLIEGEKKTAEIDLYRHKYVCELNFMLRRQISFSRIGRRRQGQQEEKKLNMLQSFISLPKFHIIIDVTKIPTSCVMWIYWVVCYR